MSDRATEFDLDVVREAIGDAGVDAWLDEYELQQYLLRQVEALGLTTPDQPIVAVNGHAADLQYR